MDKPAAGGVGGEGKYPSEVPTEAMTDFAIEMRAAFNSPVDINSTNPAEQELVQRLKERKKEGGKTKQNGVDGKEKAVQATRPSDWVKTVAFASFLDFDAQLSDEGKASMAQAADLLRGQRWMIEVRGHVSAVEAKDNKERAMRLAYDRGLAAAAELVANGLAWEQLRVVGCADNERETPRADSVEGHRSNQRVQVVTTQEPRPGDPFNGPSSNTGGGTPTLATPQKE
jgi:flagellar motor protein MotB